MEHDDYVDAIAITPNQKYVISASNGGMIKVSDIRTGVDVRTDYFSVGADKEAPGFENWRQDNCFACQS